MKKNKFTNNVVDTKYVCDLITDYDELSEISEEVDVTKANKEVQDIVIKLKNTMRANPDMLGLSAPQIGFKKRIFCLNFDGDIRTFVNPVIDYADLAKGQLTLSLETCHSDNNQKYLRLRYDNITVMYQTPTGEIKSCNLLGVAANLYQHHVDHLNGILLSDIGLPIEDDFFDMTEDEQSQIINMYLDSIDMSNANIKDEIKNNEELAKLDDMARFIDSVNKGETILATVDEIGGIINNE